MKNVILTILKWVFISVILGLLIWLTVGLYRVIRDWVRGS